MILGFLQTEYLTNGNQWERIHSVIEFYVFEMTYIFFLSKVSPDIRNLNLLQPTGHVMYQPV